MTQHNHQNEDVNLSRTLKSWEVNPPLPQGFERNVWNRIRRAESPAASPFEEWIAALRTVFQFHRALACSLLIVAAVGGVGLGKFHASTVVEKTNTELGERYLASIDPYLRNAH